MKEEACSLVVVKRKEGDEAEETMKSRKRAIFAMVVRKQERRERQ